MRIYNKTTKELIDTAPFILLNMDKVDFLYGRDDAPAAEPAQAEGLPGDMSDTLCTVDVLIPTARFVFSVEGDTVDVLPEHRSPEAFVEYRALRDARARWSA